MVPGITSPGLYIPAPLLICLQAKHPPCLGLNVLPWKRKRTPQWPVGLATGQCPVVLKNACPCVLLTPVSLSTDIMVDTPDEQSIVTYVAQFLEHFPELEAVCCFSLPLILISCFYQMKPGLGRGVLGAAMIQN